MILGLIPARCGSKGVPNKNIKLIDNKPLIAYSIECGLNSKLIDHLIVSTDSKEIAEIAKNFGSDVPFIRPKELATDTSAMLPVMQHAIIESENYYEKKVDILVLIDPTAPLRKVKDIDEAVQLLKEKKLDCVISGNEAHRNPYFNMVKIENNKVRLVLEKKNVVRRQDAPKVYDLNTIVWVYTRDAIINQKSRIPLNTELYLIPNNRSIDLDTEFDFEILDLLIKKKK